ncbi:hypothetical protein BDF21DRAFT_410424 [Thamnidium elegans]|nr:hypothetical protein BDF21DRAFT_410424 [Thamnidium elegans]
MKEIPTSFIISSRLATLEPKDIVRIVYLCGSKWNDTQVTSRMKRYPNIPIIGVGISNPVELSRVIASDIPVIHIQNDCKALIAVQKRSTRNIKLYNRFLMINSAFMWGLFGYKMMNNKLFKKGQDYVQFSLFEKGKLPVPNHIMVGCLATITAILSMVTRRILNRVRSEYSYFQQEEKVILIRNDVQYSNFSYFIRTVIPYCFIGFSVYNFRKLYNQLIQTP